jgi:hypothetical protein
MQQVISSLEKASHALQPGCGLTEVQPVQDAISKHKAAKAADHKSWISYSEPRRDSLSWPFAADRGVAYSGTAP